MRVIPSSIFSEGSQQNPETADWYAKAKIRGTVIQTELIGGEISAISIDKAEEILYGTNSVQVKHYSCDPEGYITHSVCTIKKR